MGADKEVTHKLGTIALCHNKKLGQVIVGGSTSKPALRQNTGYMVKKTYHDIAPYLGAFGAYFKGILG